MTLDEEEPARAQRIHWEYLLRGSYSTRTAKRRGIKCAFVFSIVTFVLALCVLVWILSVSKSGGSGEGGYAIIVYVMLGGYAFSVLALISLFTAALSAFAIRPARWFLIPTTLLAALAVWFLAHAEVKEFADTVGPEDIPRLIHALKKDSGADLEADVYLLAHLGADAAPSLVEALQSDDSKIRLAGAKALRDMSFRAKQVIPDLTLALHDKDRNVRAMVAEALGMACRDNEDDEIAVPGLCECLHDSDADVRREAVGALKWMTVWGNGKNLETIPPALRKAIPVLLHALNSDGDERVRVEAAEILGRMGRLADSAMPSLHNAAHDQSEWVRSVASEALAKITSDQPPTKDERQGPATPDQLR
jgi:hypothetical protein